MEESAHEKSREISDEAPDRCDERDARSKPNVTEVTSGPAAERQNLPPNEESEPVDQKRDAEERRSSSSVCRSGKAREDTRAFGTSRHGQFHSTFFVPDSASCSKRDVDSGRSYADIRTTSSRWQQGTAGKFRDGFWQSENTPGAAVHHSGGERKKGRQSKAGKGCFTAVKSPVVGDSREMNVFWSPYASITGTRSIDDLYSTSKKGAPKRLSALSARASSGSDLSSEDILASEPGDTSASASRVTRKPRKLSSAAREVLNLQVPVHKRPSNMMETLVTTVQHSDLQENALESEAGKVLSVKKPPVVVYSREGDGVGNSYGSIIKSSCEDNQDTKSKKGTVVGSSSAQEAYGNTVKPKYCSEHSSQDSLISKPKETSTSASPEARNAKLYVDEVCVLQVRLHKRPPNMLEALGTTVKHSDEHEGSQKSEAGKLFSIKEPPVVVDSREEDGVGDSHGSISSHPSSEDNPDTKSKKETVVGSSSAKETGGKPAVKPKHSFEHSPQDTVVSETADTSASGSRVARNTRPSVDRVSVYEILQGSRSPYLLRNSACGVSNRADYQQEKAVPPAASPAQSSNEESDTDEPPVADCVVGVGGGQGQGQEPQAVINIPPPAPAPAPNAGCGGGYILVLIIFLVFYFGYTVFL